MGAHNTGWIRVTGLIYGGVSRGMQHGLDRGDEIDLWDTSWGTRRDRGDGIDLRGHAIGV